MAQGIELLGQITPLLMFGESHSLAFKDLLFRPVGGDDLFLCRNRFVPKLIASEYSAGNGLSVLFADTLVGEGILDKALRPAFLNMDPSAAYIGGQPLIAPPIVFFACDTELIFLLDKLSDQFDFQLPDDPGYGVDRNKQPIPYADVLTQVQRIAEPFLKSLAMLKSAQFSRLMVHCLPPRNADENAACVFTGGVKIPKTLRSKVALLANRLLRVGCERERIGFIDTWPETSVDGYLKPDYALDGIHFNRKAALVSLEKIADYMLDTTQETFNSVRYAQLSAQSEARVPDSTWTGWSENGFVTATVPVDPAIKVTAAEPCVRPLRVGRTDWMGWPRKGRNGVHIVDPELLPLNALLRWVQGVQVDSILHIGSAVELTVSNVRCLDIEGGAAASQTDLTRRYPEGVRCAMLSLTDGLPFTAMSRDGSAVDFVAKEGTLVVFDPARVQLSPAAELTRGRVLEFALMPRLKGQSMRLISGGLSDWPCDPFQYSVKNLASSPSFGTTTFSARAQWL